MRLSARLAVVLALTLTLAAGAAFPAPPAGRAEALAALEAQDETARAEAVLWIAEHGGMQDAAPLAKRLRDPSPFVRGAAEQALWAVWTRSGDAEIDGLMARGIAEMQSGRIAESVVTFTEIIELRPEFAEGWNKRATALFLAGELEASLEDCDEVMRRNPRHFGALSGYGLIYFRQEKYAEAITAWRRALEVNPNLAGLTENIERAEALLRERRGRAI